MNEAEEKVYCVKLSKREYDIVMTALRLSLFGCEDAGDRRAAEATMNFILEFERSVTPLEKEHE